MTGFLIDEFNIDSGMSNERQWAERERERERVGGVIWTGWFVWHHNLVI
jgi:hypothetical protein